MKVNFRGPPAAARNFPVPPRGRRLGAVLAEHRKNYGLRVLRTKTLSGRTVPSGDGRSRLPYLPFATSVGNGSVGWIPALGNRVSTVRYPVPQRTFKYVATVHSVTDETCQDRK
jgi:hypothetical protein